MLKYFTKVTTPFVICLALLFAATSTQTIKADAASCAAAVAEQAAAQAEQQAACSGPNGPSSGVCQWLTTHLAQLAATTATECT